MMAQAERDKQYVDRKYVNPVGNHSIMLLCTVIYHVTIIIVHDCVDMISRYDRIGSDCHTCSASGVLEILV